MSNTRTVIVDGETFEVTIEGDGPTYHVEVGGRTFEVEVPNAGPAPKRRAGGGGKKKRSGTVSANIPGKVVTVEVTEGQHVEEGQVILILEAMKTSDISARRLWLGWSWSKGGSGDGSHRPAPWRRWVTGSCCRLWWKRL